MAALVERRQDVALVAASGVTYDFHCPVATPCNVGTAIARNSMASAENGRMPPLE
jgi:hypothetical protein